MYTAYLNKYRSLKLYSHLSSLLFSRAEQAAVSREIIHSSDAVAVADD